MAAAQIILATLNAVKKDDEHTLQTAMRLLLAAFLFLIILLSAVLEILSYPEDYDGELGVFKDTFGFLVENAEGVGNTDFIADADIQLAAAAVTDDPKRQAVIEAALSLVGKVPYFWGGKSAAGWNDEWNTPKLVTAAGSSSSGTYRPYGLDCSGFTDWVYRTAGIGDMLSPSPYGGIRGPWRVSNAIAESELLPGDLVIMYDPATTSKVNHIGLFYKHDANGKNLYIHCSSSGKGVVINSFSGFKYFRRVPGVFQT